MINIRSIVLNKRGQSVLEYIILTSLIGIFCLVGIKTFGERVKKRINYMSEQVTSHIKIN
jgi:hypothetical protein